MVASSLVPEGCKGDSPHQVAGFLVQTENKSKVKRKGQKCYIRNTCFISIIKTFSSKCIQTAGRGAFSDPH